MDLRFRVSFLLNIPSDHSHSFDSASFSIIRLNTSFIAYHPDIITSKMRGSILLSLAVFAGFAATQNATITRVETTYTTTTICPITTTSINGGSTTVVTTLTTSTLTVTSCQSGCDIDTSGPEAIATASNPILYLPVPIPRTETSIITDTETRTITNFVPSSTFVTTIGQNTFFSTWINIVYSTVTEIVTRTAYETFFPTPTVVPTSSCPQGVVCETITASGAPPVPTVTITGSYEPATNTPISPNASPSYPISSFPTPNIPTGGFPTNPGPIPTDSFPSGVRPRAFYL
ncbi:hypothetical protein KVT40_002402 [Elsinoe batatas]|uniref:Uncharacterized protein n=1 Tax=Elsinoe batatas TaxID=2601811 RepID=A0A8K0L9X1_9PEZI|nr:hypothetical protein KVT40_002402 [Elsinoe batatas]